MATIAVGDIHGNLSALSDILLQIKGESTRGDTIVFLGDYIDRGPDSKGCVEAILGFKDQIEAEVVCLIGNHEDWLLRTLHDHSRHSWLLGMEAFETIRSYSVEAEIVMREAVINAGSELFAGRCALPYAAFIDSMPQEHIGFFEGLQLYCRTVDCLCVHGGLDRALLSCRIRPAMR